MKNFLAIYLGTPAGRVARGWDTMDAQQREALEAKAIQAWGDWMTTHDAAIVDAGGPLGKTRRVSRDGISQTVNNLTGYVIVKAESQDAAARMFENHPHFSLFPGDGVEIVEVLPIPGA